MYIYCKHEGLTINLDHVEEFEKKGNDTEKEKKFMTHFIFTGDGQTRSLYYSTEESRDEFYDKIIAGLREGKSVIHF